MSARPASSTGADFVPFTAQTRMSGVDLGDRLIRKGAASAVMKWVRDNGGHPTGEVGELVDAIATSGGTPLVVAEKVGDQPATALGVVHLKDVIKDGIRERFDEMRRMGIRTVMITGDNPQTARAIAAEAGVDDFLAEATPEDKMALIKREQDGGRLVAMTGDGTNDAPALAQADVGVAMNTGTSSAKEAGNMVDLDSNPTKLIEIVEIGKQLLITRGSLTTFSIANDVAKYFAIIPAMFAGVFPGLDRLNVMHLESPQSAILSAVVFNALIIIGLIPLALRGVRYTPSDASAMLRRNLAIYGLGGIVAPFVGHQAHRPRRLRSSPASAERHPPHVLPDRLSVRPAAVGVAAHVARPDRPPRPRLPPGAHRPGPGGLPVRRRRLPRPARRPGHRLRAHRPVLHRPAAVLPVPPVGGR